MTNVRDAPDSSDDAGPSAMQVEIDIPSSVDLVTVVRMIVASAATAAGSLDGDRLDDLRWVTSEATTNAIQANLLRAEEPDAKCGRVWIDCALGSGWVKLRVEDEGLGMTGAPEVPDITHPDRLLIEGGFGVPLMQHLTRGAMDFATTSTGTMVELRVESEDTATGT